MRVLVIEDDVTTQEYVAKGLRESGHVVEAFSDGKEGFGIAMVEGFDVIVVDRMLPGLDGLSLVSALRTAGNRTPVLFLTALGDLNDRVEGLNSGADDYLAKPFAFSELLARVNALGRRPPMQTEATSLQVGDLHFDLLARSVTRSGVDIDLKPRELALLEVLMRNAGRVTTRTMLLEQVWDFHFDPKTSVVETHISRLRAKIDKPFDTPLLQTIRNTGYRLHAPD